MLLGDMLAHHSRTRLSPKPVQPSRSRNFAVFGIPPIRGNPSGRLVASMQRLPVATWRRTKISAIRGATLNSVQVVTPGVPGVGPAPPSGSARTPTGPG